ncbi:hypothetical protein RvY_16613-2 [Ramazzottius varieornatus]|uniref:Uncharacterized protein n=1 Tax=Ramazzottius varieornatus TaxID=947166 RepID=A0A1D1VZ42_RAMVA|nr:hypothetical protein RvY_16613-2 [Ramazzottius varieornatus]
MLLQVYEAYALGSSCDYMYFLTQFFWFLTYALQILIVLYAGSHLHEAAHSVLSHAYKIDQSRLTLSEGLQIQTLLNKLACNQIGFTAWRMFTITNEAVLGVRMGRTAHCSLRSPWFSADRSLFTARCGVHYPSDSYIPTPT